MELQRCMEECTEIHGGLWRFVGVYWLPLVTIDLVGDILMCYSHFWVLDSLRILKIHHCFYLISLAGPMYH